MEPVQGAHEVVAARDFLGRHKQDLHGRGVPAQTLQQLPGLAVVLGATEVAAGYARLLQVEHLQPVRGCPVRLPDSHLYALWPQNMGCYPCGTPSLIVGMPVTWQHAGGMSASIAPCEYLLWPVHTHLDSTLPECKAVEYQPTWSWMRDTKGEMTMVTPENRSAGS